eukprot:CAMPEP_0179064518 /NCGR_PEP_ID=MMETSP0796-20121207/27989_1 /TAXON_ID=73915 /ORGANISM="Pyrodinium bahamense, Strain pbaha01" /LENGTH=393 /DNA_ID=CAMNT_0020761467 /DNA_START=956 /DNA_END=2138 /DNA_ORIENTATION=+
MDLPEWQGFVTPEVAAARVTTTTLDPMQMYLSRPSSTTLEPSLSEMVKPLLPYIIVAVSAVGLMCIAAIFLYLGCKHVRAIRKSVIGPSRLLSIFRSDPVSVFVPSSTLPKDLPDKLPLPKVRPWQEVEAERADRAACAALGTAVRAAEQHGPNNTGAVPGSSALREEVPLRRAIAAVRERGLQDSGRNAELISRGERWLGTLEAERSLLAATEAARPLLQVVGQRMTMPPLPGAPWQATAACRREEGEIQRAAWQKVELLGKALQAARAEGASDVLLRQAAELLAQLVARTPELPADRCVLDPEGDGLRLLPMGMQRAVWLQTGDPYLFSPESKSVGELGESLPPREQLGGVSVDDSRPVCAEYGSGVRAEQEGDVRGDMSRRNGATPSRSA